MCSSNTPQWLYNNTVAGWQGGWSAGTAFVTFDDVQVPAENLIGQEGRGFRIILENFNHVPTHLNTAAASALCLSGYLALYYM